MMQVIGLPAFSDNYIWMIQDADNPRVVLVDPGEAEPALEALARHRLELAAILVTHHHGDHIGGIAELRTHYEVPVYGPRRESISQVTQTVAEADEIEIEGTPMRFHVMDVPGHTRGHVAYLGHGCLFCGDTLFTAGCGRLFEGSPEQMHQSLEKIRALDPGTRIYCAHEYTQDNLRFAQVVEPHNIPLRERVLSTRQYRDRDEPTVPSLLSLELATNPFLRCQEATVVAAAEAFSGRTLKSGAEVFAVIRHWKDTLD